MTYFTRKVNHSLSKPPLKTFNGSSAKLGITSLAKQATKTGYTYRKDWRTEEVLSGSEQRPETWWDVCAERDGDMGEVLHAWNIYQASCQGIQFQQGTMEQMGYWMPSIWPGPRQRRAHRGISKVQYKALCMPTEISGNILTKQYWYTGEVERYTHGYGVVMMIHTIQEHSPTIISNSL